MFKETFFTQRKIASTTYTCTDHAEVSVESSAVTDADYGEGFERRSLSTGVIRAVHDELEKFEDTVKERLIKISQI
jgi:hypothetical protein